MERELIHKAQRGDLAAYDQLFSLYEIEIYKLAYVYVKNRDDALDLVQEVAYRSCKAIKSLKESSYYKTWLIKILMNCAVDLLKKRPQHEELEPILFNVPSEAEVDLDVKVTLEGVMQHLNKEEKDVVLLKYYEDYTFEQIADCLGMKLGSVKTVLYRALRKLKVALEKEGTSYEEFKG